jgi:hypothetical protein
MSSRVQKIIESIRSKAVNYVPPPFVPVCNFEKYLADKARTEYRIITSLNPLEHNIPKLLKESADNLAFIAQQHRDTVYVEQLKEKEKKREPSKDYNKVVTVTKIKNGVVCTEEHRPIEYLYVNYFNKGIKPPIGVYLRQLKLLGYSEQALAKVLERHEKLAAQKPELEEFIVSVFGDDSSKKKKPKSS